jgi:hypothetical protein
VKEGMHAESRNLLNGFNIQIPNSKQANPFILEDISHLLSKMKEDEKVANLPILMPSVRSFCLEGR